MKTKDMTKVAMMAAVLCVLGPMTIPIGAIPITMANLAVMLAGALLGPAQGCLAVLIYLLIGIAGVPVFSNYGAGLAKLTGPTGGFLIGYLPCALMAGLGVRLGGEGRRRYWVLPVMLVAGTAVLYALGMAWFMVLQKVNVAKAFAVCAADFILLDLIKIVFASVIVWPVRASLAKLSLA